MMREGYLVPRKVLAGLAMKHGTLSTTSNVDRHMVTPHMCWSVYANGVHILTRQKCLEVDYKTLKELLGVTTACNMLRNHVWLQFKAAGLLKDGVPAMLAGQSQGTNTTCACTYFGSEENMIKLLQQCSSIEKDEGDKFLDQATVLL